jgi:hypothetical protein
MQQVEVDALFSWGAIHIIDHLPFLLHISLLLFSIGLVVYLGRLDPTMVTIMAVISGATASFYDFLTLLGAVYKTCPFDTQVSYYLRKFLRVFVNRWRYAQDDLKQHFKIKILPPLDQTM